MIRFTTLIKLVRELSWVVLASIAVVLLSKTFSDLILATIPGL